MIKEDREGELYGVIDSIKLIPASSGTFCLEIRLREITYDKIGLMLKIILKSIRAPWSVEKDK